MEQNKYLDPKEYTVVDCGFSVRAYNFLRCTLCGADTTIEELYEMIKDGDIRKIQGCGRKTFTEVWLMLEKFGYQYPGTKKGDWVKAPSGKYAFVPVKMHYRKEDSEKDSSQLELHPYNGDEGIGYTIRLNGYRIIIIPENR